jgi:hypothetical protein
MSLRVFLTITLHCLTSSPCLLAQDDFNKAFKKDRLTSQPQGKKSSFEMPAELLITEQHGPFHVFVASYVGEDSARFAYNLAMELREKHRLPAFVCDFRLDPNKDLGIYQPSQEEIERMKKQFKGKAPRFPKLHTPVVDHWAVLVGNFPSLEDRGLETMKARILRLTPNSFSPQVANELRWGNDQNGKPKNQLVGIRGTVNPKSPKDKRLTKNDLATLKMLKDMNDQEQYSVYQNNAPYTIFVYKFRGSGGLVDTGKKDSLGRAKKVDGLVIAGNNARVLCDVMRKMGYEAYVFHSTTCSCVCVGGYRFPDARDPKIVEDFQKFSKMKISELQLEPDVLPTPKDPGSVLQAN